MKLSLRASLQISLLASLQRLGQAPQGLPPHKPLKMIKVVFGAKQFISYYKHILDYWLALTCLSLADMRPGFFSFGFSPYPKVWDILAMAILRSVWPGGACLEPAVGDGLAGSFLPPNPLRILDLFFKAWSVTRYHHVPSLT